MIGWLGRKSMARLGQWRRILALFGQCNRAFFKQCVRGRFRWRETADQLFVVGVESLPIVFICLSFVSLMMALELSFHMKLILRQDSLVPAFSTVLLVRELAPTVTCLLFASRVGAGMAAEIGLMKETEQLDALRVLSLDPIDYLATPRWVASLFGCVGLTLLAIVLAISNVWWLSKEVLGFSGHWENLFLFIRYQDFLVAGLKAAVFGTLASLIACDAGFRAGSGSFGIGEAATQAVVRSSVAIIIADFLLTYVSYAA